RSSSSEFSAGVDDACIWTVGGWLARGKAADDRERRVGDVRLRLMDSSREDRCLKDPKRLRTVFGPREATVKTRPSCALCYCACTHASLNAACFMLFPPFTK